MDSKKCVCQTLTIQITNCGKCLKGNPALCETCEYLIDYIDEIHECYHCFNKFNKNSKSPINLGV